MPAPNKAKHKKVTKAYAKARLDEGATYREIAEETGVSLGTLSNWKGEIEQSPQELEKGKKVLTLLDYDNLAKANYIISSILDETIERVKNGELKKEDLKSLSRAGVELSKIYGIITDKVLMRDGLLTLDHTRASPATMLALLLAKAASDREAAARLDSERAMFEAAKGKGKDSDIIDVNPSS